MAKRENPESLRQKLAALPAETLADALVTLSFNGGPAEAMVTRLTATKAELTKQISRRLTGIRRRRKFLFRSQAPELAAELSDLLADIQAADLPPDKGLALVARFVQLDGKVFEICDDSYGSVGAVFHGEVPPVFWAYATRSGNPARVVDLMVELLSDDPWSTRTDLLDNAPDLLPDEALALLRERLWQAAQDDALPTDERQHWLFHVMHLARVAGDPDRYRAAAKLELRTDRATRAKLVVDGLTIHDAIELGQLYLRRGRADEALALGQAVLAQDNSFRRDDCEELVQKAHGALGQHDQEAAMARRRFDADPSAQALTELLAIVGEAARDEIVDQTLADATRATRLDFTELRFMLEMGRADLAAAKVVELHDQLDGEQYYILPPLADELIKADEYLAATLILRALVAANLARANSTYYSHGVRYLLLAGRIAGAVRDWGEHADHENYFAELREQHQRKVSFWKRYDGRGK